MIQPTTAFVFQGLQNDFCQPEGALYARTGPQLEERQTVSRVITLIPRLLELGVPVYFVPIVFTPDYRELRGVGGILGAIRDAGAFQEGSWGAEPIDELAPFLPNLNLLPPKRGLCAFGSTPLEAALKSRRVNTVAVGGLLTNVCVESTARTAYDLGYRVILLSDATATTSAQAQRASEELIFPLLGEIQTCQSFLTTTLGTVRDAQCPA